MNFKDKRFDWGAGNDHNTNLLRIGVVFLSVVSFFTTANGMMKYIFVDNGMISYAASAAIQGILLALSMNLPGYLLNICKKQGGLREGESRWRSGSRKVGRFFWKSFLCIFSVSLTLVTIFSSSWFSYIYIADILHQDSWETDSELLVQQTYRTQLYDAQDYAHNYRIYLEESIGEELLLLETQATGLSNFVENLSMDWAKERQTYAPDDGSTASGYMATVIKAMEDAMKEDASQEARELAVTAVSDAKENISGRMADIQRTLKTINDNITMYNNQIQAWEAQRNRETEAASRQALTDLIAQNRRLISDANQRQGNLQTEYFRLESALQRLPFYESQLGLSSSTSAISIQSDLIQLQSEFFTQEPNEEQMLATAEEIFKKLRNASRIMGGGENGNSAGSVDDPDSSNAQDNGLSYTALMLQMNRLIRNLTNYADIKDIESSLEKLVDDLRQISGGSAIIPPIAETGEQSPPPETSDPAETLGPVETDGPTETSAPAETDSPVETPEPAGTDDPAGIPEPGPEAANSNKEGQDGQWKTEWTVRVANLKAQISAMPTYSVGDKSNNTNGIGETIDNTSTGFQVDILQNYDRDNSCKKLDDITRRYLSNHNAVYNGLIYLQSSYSSLAIFALILALSFDLSGFVFGFIMQGEPQKGNSNAAESGRVKPIRPSQHDAAGENPASSLADEDSRTQWSILEPLNPYIVLTGDYTLRDSIYYYKTFKDGILYEWAVEDVVPYPQGIYIQVKSEGTPSKGKLLSGDDQKLLFAGQEDGPLDGIYMDCQLAFNNGSLLLIQNGQSSFLACIDEYVPVHTYNPKQGENCTIPAMELTEQKFHAKIAVVALNEAATRIVAIYTIADG